MNTQSNFKLFKLVLMILFKTFKKTCSKVDTLQKICEAFNISLSDFFLENENTISLNKEELKLIKNFVILNLKEKETVKSLIYVLKKKE